MQNQTKNFVFSVKLIEYNFSPLSNFSGVRTKISFFVLLIFVDEYPYLSISVFLVNSTAPKKQFSSAG